MKTGTFYIIIRKICRKTAYVLPMLLLLLCACEEKKPDHPGRKVNYIYLDKRNVLHVKRGCGAVYKGSGGIQPVRPMRAGEVTEPMLRKICSQCVSERHLVYLSDIIDYRTRDDVGTDEEEFLDTMAVEEE